MCMLTCVALRQPNGLLMYENVAKIGQMTRFLPHRTPMHCNVLQHIATHVGDWNAIQNEWHCNASTHVMCIVACCGNRHVSALLQSIDVIWL